MNLLRHFVDWINRARRNGEYAQYKSAGAAFDAVLVDTVRTLKGEKN